MITGELKSKVDRIWEAFWTGGISNPLTVIEQFSYLIFIKRLDDMHTLRERKARRLEQPIERPIFTEEQAPLRWSHFKHLAPQAMFDCMQQEVFPFMKNLPVQEGATFHKFMADATFMIAKPSLLQRVVEMIDELPMDDRDTKGDLYEYLLSQLSTAGKNGQFRTPRHIIQMMVELMAPGPKETICDPSCGTAGFLVASEEYVTHHHPEVLSDPVLRDHFETRMFNGFDFDPSMLRIASMNMMLHGIENPRIEKRDSLSRNEEPITDAYSLILANPPFKGSLDYDEVAKDLLQQVKTKKTELLFMALILRQLKVGGRAAVIIPDGVLFGSSKAHVSVREALVEGHKLEAVISMPSGVFKPYAGVSTGIAIFTKTNTGGTDQVWFYDMQADGYSLDDKRNPLGQKQPDGSYVASHDNNNIPDIIQRWRHLEQESDRPRTAQSFFVPKADIAANKYDLSINRYKEIVYEAVAYDPPAQILKELQALEDEIQQGLKELSALIG